MNYSCCPVAWQCAVRGAELTSLWTVDSLRCRITHRQTRIGSRNRDGEFHQSLCRDLPPSLHRRMIWTRYLFREGIRESFRVPPGRRRGYGVDKIRSRIDGDRSKMGYFLMCSPVAIPNPRSTPYGNNSIEYSSRLASVMEILVEKYDVNWFGIANGELTSGGDKSPASRTRMISRTTL